MTPRGERAVCVPSRAGIHGGMGRGFRHEALLYRDEREFLDGVVPFVEDGLAGDEPVLVALADEKVALLERELGSAAADVQFVDMTPLGRNPARIIPVWRQFVAAAAPARAMRGIGEPAWPGRSDAEFIECDHHESLLNRAFAEAAGFTLLCPYDAAGLPGEVLEGARRNHPRLIEDGRRQGSDAYLHPDVAPAPLKAALPPPATEPVQMAFRSDDLAAIRRLVGERAESAGLDPSRQTDLVFSVNELAANSIRHGGGAGTVRVWRDDLGLHSEVLDAGTIDDPLAGRARPSASQENGRGLWLVNQLCDLVQLRSGPAGTVARVTMRLS
jgi:anti-sigma regulatory factor (Ser/Thr protein kinase)